MVPRTRLGLGSRIGRVKYGRALAQDLRGKCELLASKALTVKHDTRPSPVPKTASKDDVTKEDVTDRWFHFNITPPKPKSSADTSRYIVPAFIISKFEAYAEKFRASSKGAMAFLLRAQCVSV